MVRLTQKIWNNIFWYDHVFHSKIWIAETIDWDIDDLNLWENTVFREMKNWKVVEYVWLKNFIKIKKNNQTIYVFDNHNHALKYWIDEYKDWNIQFGFHLIHLDQHTDMNKSEFELDVKNPNLDVYNVWNFIQPAINCWLISNVEQINTEYKLLNFEVPNYSYILDIDLDFWAPEMSIEKYLETIEKTKTLISKSRVVTMATSPYFLDQNIAFRLINKLLN